MEKIIEKMRANALSRSYLLFNMQCEILGLPAFPVNVILMGKLFSMSSFKLQRQN